MQLSSELSSHALHHIFNISCSDNSAVCLLGDHLNTSPKSPHEVTFSNHWPGSFPSSQYPTAEVVNFVLVYLGFISSSCWWSSWFWIHWLFPGEQWVWGLGARLSHASGPWPKPWGGHSTGVTASNHQGCPERRQWSEQGLRRHNLRYSDSPRPLHFSVSSMSGYCKVNRLVGKAGFIKGLNGRVVKCSFMESNLN